MSIAHHKGNPFGIKVTDSEAIKAYGFITFFENPIPGYSIEELTPPNMWFTDENLGPWDWKVDVVQSGEIVYGKFLCGGKSAFAAPDWYAHIRNWKLSPRKIQADRRRTEGIEAHRERRLLRLPSSS